jgi:fibronectin type 3 domain-containing protein
MMSADNSKDWLTSLDFTCTTATTTAHSVKLNWQASSSTGVTGYDVYRSTVSGGYYGLLGNSTSLAYTDTSVQSGATYYYVVTAVNSAGVQSGYSNQVQTVIP